MFYIIGSACIDIFAKSKQDIIMHDSNPGTIRLSLGGVGRNIAVNLANNGLPVKFISVFGDDYFSRIIYDELIKNDIDLSLSRWVSGYSSPLYLALLNNDDLALGISDMSLLNLFSLDMFEKLNSLINDDDYLIFDTNLDGDLISFLCHNLGGIKVLDAISANKVGRIAGYSQFLDIFKLNLLEAETFGGEVLDSDEKIKNFILKQYKLGTKQVIITYKSGLYLNDGPVVYKFIHYNFRQNPLNVTGAGDALLAYFVLCKFRKFDLVRAVYFALAASILTVDCLEAVADISLELLNSKIEDLVIDSKEL